MRRIVQFGAGAWLTLAGAACQKAPEPGAQAELAGVPSAPRVETPATRPGPPVPVDVPSLAPLVERILPTVVSVEPDARGAATFSGDDEDEASRDLPAGHPPVRSGHRSRERAGAGVLVGERGLILTSFHLVDGSSSLVVHLADGRTFPADLVGRDGPTDLALLRIRNAPASLPVARLRDSRQLAAGEWVLAVGNPFGLSSSVTLGIVSALDRRLGGSYDDFLQTDAALNPGSSGGPLFDLGGAVVGIATVAPRVAGVGFAIPSSLVLGLLPQLEREGGVTRGALGVLFQEMAPTLGRALGVRSGQGALISGVRPDSAAERAGLQTDDVVVAVGGQPVISRDHLIRTVALLRPAARVTLTLVRAGKSQDVQVTLGQRNDLEDTGPLSGATEVRARSHPADLGLELDDLNRDLARRLRVDEPGALVVGVTPGSAADAAGLVPGLVITELGRTRVRSALDAAAALKAAHGGRNVLVRVLGPGGTPHLHTLDVP